LKNLSIDEKNLLSQLIKSCEYYHLNEKQSIECINKILNRNISRRSYYNYKHKIYSHDIFNKLKDSIYSSPLDRCAILLHIDDGADLEVRAKANTLIADQFPNKNPSPLQSSYHNDMDENSKDKLKDILLNIKQFKDIEKLSKNRLNALPKNATVREELVKCGKDACSLCPHGPYYYAYWRD
jgi:hypothetical protein